ncbi:peptide deformylase [Siminovitchia terrae]|uniref:Peptide deformylase n=1 Tax=Siminovitchia terrae TaxID=1914933 RepID=A0A429XBV5_SIMTE|nr:peptide deformylase [Siminovitchia terrae]RST60900.1 peptide deformylase [Siminovitchia terrae]GIN91525.1 peptide deformylase [Siminovitchia terrae]GIN94537.1 peptide deformylase [Siminovitchia terrae]
MLLMKDIIREGHPTLRRIAKEVPLPPDPADIETLKSMKEFLINSQDPVISEKYGIRGGVGLAAPQINVSKRMFVMRLNDEKGEEHDYSFINPKIVSHSVEKSYLTSGEGCLSVDRSIPGYVQRHARITVKGYNEKGEEIKLRLRGLPAIVFQHELDHLNGVMFYDHIDEKNPFQLKEGAIPIEN